MVLIPTYTKIHNIEITTEERGYTMRPWMKAFISQTKPTKWPKGDLLWWDDKGPYKINQARWTLDYTNVWQFEPFPPPTSRIPYRDEGIEESQVFARMAMAQQRHERVRANRRVQHWPRSWQSKWMVGRQR